MYISSHKKLLRILAMILVLALTLGCLAACGNDNSNDEEDEDKGDKGSSTGKLVQHSWKGLNFELPDNYEDMSNEGYAFFRTNTVSICVSDETTPANITDSQGFANYYKNTQGTNYKTISISSKDGVYYTVGDYGDGTMEVRGFYVNGNHCWFMYTSCYTENYSDDQISLVTCGTIDKSYQYTPDDNGSEYPGPTSKPSTPSTPLTPDPKPQQPSTPSLKQHSYEGLSYKLGEDYSGTNTGSSMQYSNGSTTINVVSSYLPDGVTDTSSWADRFMKNAQDEGYSSTKNIYNSVYCVITNLDNNTKFITGFYAYNGYGWAIQATTYNYATEGDLLIQYVTSGVIDKSYPHAPNPSTPSTPDDGQLHVYTLVPADWSTPGLWAWQNSTQQNAFASWPGESMKWNGKYYVATAPDWVDCIIINGGNGSVQTEDIAIEQVKDVWVIIEANGGWYEIFYSEPSAAKLAEMGY